MATDLKPYRPDSKLEKYFRDYDAYHRTAGNEICHAFGVPMIAVSVLGLLARFSFGPREIFGSPLLQLDAGLIFWALAVIWYSILDWRLGSSFGFVALGGYFFSRTLPVPALWAFFVVGWIIQGIGHAVYEKRSPAFFRNVAHLLIGPLWIFARLTGVRS